MIGDLTACQMERSLVVIRARCCSFALKTSLCILSFCLDVMADFKTWLMPLTLLCYSIDVGKCWYLSSLKMHAWFIYE